MAQLSQEQIELLVWVVESGGGPYVFVQTHSSVDALVGKDARREVNGGDVRELAAQGLIREAGGKSYEVTNAGRVAYQELTSPPPPEPPPVGFQNP